MNLFNLGVEKTILDGRASLYGSVPLLWATDNISGQPINGLGDINAGLKFVFLRNPDSGNLLSGGLTVTAPTGRRSIVRTTATTTTTKTNTNVNATATATADRTQDPINFPPNNIDLTVDAPVITATSSTSTSTKSAQATTSLNPTYVQPWVGGLLVIDRVFVESYVGVMIPSDQRVATVLNTNFNVGYNLYSNPDGWVSSLTPVLGMQAVVGLTNTQAGSTLAPAPSDSGTPQLPSSISFGFPSQVFVSGLLQMGIGTRTSLYGGVVTPVVSPKGYDVGGIMGINFLY